jgi:hypothetical protein
MKFEALVELSQERSDAGFEAQLKQSRKAEDMNLKTCFGFHICDL